MMSRHLGSAFAIVVCTLTLVLVLEDHQEASASPGDACRHESDCSPHELCVADSWSSSWGHCAAIRVLP
jgi:hypothetical protein